jgi:hypothetical protein
MWHSLARAGSPGLLSPVTLCELEPRGLLKVLIREKKSTARAVLGHTIKLEIRE